MNRMIFLAVAVLLVPGCWSAPTATPVAVPAGVTIEIYATAAKAGPNTTPDVDPTTKATIHLITPPVIATTDIATVAKSEMAVETIGGAPPSDPVPSLEIVFTPAGAQKMKAATTTPTSTNLAIVVNGVVVSVPKIVTPIHGTCRVTGDHRDPVFLNALSAATGQP